jgi:hypothetical protein
MVGAQQLREGPGAAEHVVEHPADGGSVKGAGAHGQADHPSRERIHHDLDPMGSQDQ